MKAFTLLEVLASIALFAVMTLGIASTMRETNKLTLRVKQRQATSFTGLLALSALHRDLSLSFNERIQKTPSLFRCKEGNTGPHCVFSVMESPLNTLFEKRTPGIQVVHYKLEKDDNGTMKLLRAEAPLHNFENLENQATQIIATGVLKMEMEFYQSDADQWVKTWDSSNPSTLSRFPKVVRVAIETINPDIPQTEWKDKSLRFQTEVVSLNEWEDR